MYRLHSLFLVIGLALLASCVDNEPQPESPDGSAPAGLELSSPAFEPGGTIPRQYTCQGEDLSPALVWPGAPEGSKSLALIVDDPDAPVGTWVHWVVYNIPTGSSELPEGASKANGAQFNLPPGAIQGSSSFKRSDWGGPCPPSGTHRYFFRLYALDIAIDEPGLDKTSLLKAMQGHVLATGELMGTYQKE